MAPCTFSEPNQIHQTLPLAGLTTTNSNSNPTPHKCSFDELSMSLPLIKPECRAFLSCIGNLRYLSDCFHFDLAYATSIFATFVLRSTKLHLCLLKHVLRCLKQTIKYWILLPASPTTKWLNTFSDSNFADEKDCEPISSIVQLFHNASICYCCKEQSVIAPGTCESEVIATSSATRKIIWLRNTLAEMTGKPLYYQVALNMNSASAIKVALHTAKTKLRKLMNIRIDHINNHVSQKYIHLSHVTCTNNVTYSLAKSLHAAKIFPTH